VNALSREALLGAIGCPEEPVAVVGLKAVVVMKGLTGEALDEYHQSITTGKGNKRDVNMANLRTKLLVRTIHIAVPSSDGKTFTAGARMFADDDAAALGKIRGDVIGQLFPIAQKLSGLSDEEVEELGKPSTTTNSATSSSSSHSN
jgi:hypothetical protein